MKNLTPNQQNIIDSLVNEFTKMNVPTKVGSGLINISQIISDYDVKQKRIEEVKLNNARFKQVAIDMCQKDFDLIKDEIESLGIKIAIDSEHKTSFTIGRYTRDTFSMQCMYYIDTKYCDISKMHVSCAVSRKSYLNPNNIEEFSSLEKWTSDARFINGIKRLYEEVQYKK